MEGVEEKPASYQARQAFAEYFARHLISKFSGEGADRIHGDRPSSGAVFVGTLLPRSDLRRRWPRRASPTEIGVEVLIPENVDPQARLEIRLKGGFYYRVFPSLDEQLVRKLALGGAESEETEVEEKTDFEESAQPPPSVRMLKKLWKKAGPYTVEANVEISRLMSEGQIHLTEGEEVAGRALREWRDDDRKYRKRKFKSRRLVDQLEELTVPVDVLEDNVSFETYLEEWYRGRTPKPKWSTVARIETRPYREGVRRVAVIFENVAEEGMRPREDVDNAVFESEVVVVAQGFEFRPFVLDRLRDDYRHTGKVPGIGINCVAEAPSLCPLTSVRTVHTPTFREIRLRPKRFEADMEVLAKDPVPYLRKLRKQMEEHAGELRDLFAERLSELSSLGQHYFERDIKLFEGEFKRFSVGLSVLEQVPEALEAFRLTNATFRASSKRFSHWYRFQIVFLVCLIPDLIAIRFPSYKNRRNHVDVIYFPTGGGKTEAYLGAVVFQMFFDRLMGKKSGVSAITRFPLRLLSLQQIQRIADVFGAAETLRRTHEVISGTDYDPFSTGYFVGRGNTPNFLYRPGYGGEGEEDEISPIVSDQERGDKYKIIDRCPFCRSRHIQVVGDLDDIRIKLVCQDCEETLPVFISDDEIYRYLPTFIVGTLDKMASAGWRRHFRHLFGKVTHRCPDHGYLSGGRCLYAGPNNRCRRDPSEYIPVSIEDPTPSILIQDEMHLVRESLGCYDSHYETLMDHLVSVLTGGTKALKIIAATATITDTDIQLHHLYMRHGAEFPSRGPNPRESFYYSEDPQKLARIIVGILPHNKTMVYSVLDLLYHHARAIRRWRNDPSELIEDRVLSGTQEAEGVLEEYSTALSYNLMKMQGDAVNHSIRTMVNPLLRSEDLGEVRAHSMTGDVTFARVRRVLEMLETRPMGIEIDLVTATSMISHGVDIDVLNFMVFQGMPSSTAEYIQAYSRVGRRSPGIVIVVFNQARERDASHYRYFGSYHELSDLLVEPVPINRWAKFSIDRTLSGIFCAAIMNYFEPRVQDMGHKRLYMTDDFADAINKGLLTEEELVEFILNSYRVNQDDMGVHFQKVIQDRVRQLIGALTAPAQNKFISFAVSPRPLTNLRDVDIQVEISPTARSYEPMQRVSAPPPGGAES
ncbi:MAG: helicase-related protein [bacterium]